MTSEGEESSLRRSRQLSGAACLTLRQLWHTLLPFFYTFISCHSVYPTPYLSALFVFKSSLTCPSSKACHHLVYNCFKGLRRVLETPTALNLTWQPGIVRSLFLSVSLIFVLWGMSVMVVRNSLCVVSHSSVNLHQFVSHSDILNRRFPSFLSFAGAPVQAVRFSQGKWLIFLQRWLF